MTHHSHPELEELGPLHRESNMSRSELESRIHSIEELARDQSLMIENRFNELGRNLERLADQLLRIVLVETQEIASRQGASAIETPSRVVSSSQAADACNFGASTNSFDSSPNLTEPEVNRERVLKQQPEHHFGAERAVRTSPKPLPSMSRKLSYQNDKIVSEWAKIEGIRPTTSMLLDDSDRISTVAANSAGLIGELTSDANEVRPNAESFSRLPENQSIAAQHGLAGDLSTATDVFDSQLTVATGMVDAPAATSPISDLGARDESQIDEPPAVEFEKPKQESVAELLARLKAEGQWNGIEDQPESASTATKSTSVISPPPPSPLVQPQPPVHATDHSSSSGAEDDVEDYMAQLLARMRGDAGPTQPAAKPSPQFTHPTPSSLNISNSTPMERDGLPNSVDEHPEVMRAEDYVPRQRPEKILSLSKMRELANTTARTAVASSEEQRRHALAYMQLAIGVAALAMSGYYFGVSMKNIGDTSCIIGVICLGLTGFLGFRFHTTINSKPTELE